MNTTITPKQDRSLRTQEALIQGFVALLEEQSFEELTVAQIAAKAGLTTGAIYRRFKDKRALLASAFERFIEESVEKQRSRAALTAGKSDREKVEAMIRSTLKFTIPYLPLMRAASSLNDQPSFESMRQARNIASDWWAAQITTSTYPEDQLRQRMRFAMRTITAVLRDTLLAGPGADSHKDSGRGKAVERMVSDLTDMVCLYLAVEDQSAR